MMVVAQARQFYENAKPEQWFPSLFDRCRLVNDDTEITAR
jgi:hypothetical protein